MSQINYLKELTEEESNLLNEEKLSFSKKVLRGDFGVSIYNTLYSFLHNLESIVKWNDIPRKKGS